MTSEESNPVYDKIEDACDELLNSGALGSTIGLRVGWVLLIAEHDPLSGASYTSMAAKQGMAPQLIRGMLEECRDRLAFQSAHGFNALIADDEDDDE